jgi:hypothetical protein
MWDSLDKPATLYIANLDDEARALEIAKEIVAKTGGVIIVKRWDGTEIETVSQTKQ